MGLPKQRLKNVRSTGIKLSKVKAMKFKRMKAPTTIDMRNVQEHVEGMDNATTSKQSSSAKLTKKRLLRQQRKEELRKCFRDKRKKSRATVPDSMEVPVEEPDVIQQKINNNRLRNDTLPMNTPAKTNQLKVREKELATSSVVSGRRISKKKARKIMNAIKRNQREADRKAAFMDTTS